MTRLTAATVVLLIVSAACGGTKTDGGRRSAARRPVVSSTSAPPTTTTTTTTLATTTTTVVPARTPTTLTGDPAAIATELTRVETAIRDPATPPGDMPALGQTQQMIYRRLGVQPQLAAAVVARVSPSLRAVVEGNVTPRRELAPLVPRRAEPPPWRIRPPKPADELLGYYREAEATFGVPWAYLAAINLVETYMGRIRSASTANAQGPMQFIPSTWAAYGKGDINNDRDAILAAGRYLRANGAPDRMANALYRYNPSNHYVRAVTAYAQQMLAHERAYLGYYHWQVTVSLTTGDMVLPEGYGA